MEDHFCHCPGPGEWSLRWLLCHSCQWINGKGRSKSVRWRKGNEFAEGLSPVNPGCDPKGKEAREEHNDLHLHIDCHNRGDVPKGLSACLCKQGMENEKRQRAAKSGFLESNSGSTPLSIR